MKRLVRTPTYFFAGAADSLFPEVCESYAHIVSVMGGFGRVLFNDNHAEQALFERGSISKSERDFWLMHPKMERDFWMLQQANALVVDLTDPSAELGVHIDYAVRSGLPVFAAYRKFNGSSDGSFFHEWKNSPCPPKEFTLAPYSSGQELESRLSEFLLDVQKNHPSLPGAYLVNEGGEGSGKDWQSEALARYLKGKGIRVVPVREPGGIVEKLASEFDCQKLAVRRAEAIRTALLVPGETEKMSHRAELFLFEAARSQLTDILIKPVLAQEEHTIVPGFENGTVVISNRNRFSSEAYQGWGRGLGLDTLDLLNDYAMGGIKPDLGFIIDSDPEIVLAKATDDDFGKKDRIQGETLEFHKRVRQGYLNVAKRMPNIHVIPYLPGQPQEMQAMMRKIVDDNLLNRFVDI